MIKAKFDPLFSEVNLRALCSGVDDSSMASYKAAWAGRGRCCFVRGISVWLTPGDPGWDEPLLHFPIWASKVLGRKSPKLKGRFAAIRHMRPINGGVDFSLQSHRAREMVKGLGKLEGAMRKKPPNMDFLRWTHGWLVCKSDARSNGAGSVRFELFAACMIGFIYLLRISEIGSLKWGDISVDTYGGRSYFQSE